MKEIIYNKEARLMLKRGADKLNNATKVTLGPKGRNVVIGKFGSPIITKDGITVAKEVELENRFENIGAEIGKMASSKTNDKVGDFTTTTIVLYQAIFNEGLKLLKAGFNPIEIRRGIEKRVAEIILELKKISKPISTKEEIAQVASISANDKEIGNIIAEAMESVGKEGIITIEEGQSFGVEKEIVEGMQIDRGYISPYMITNQKTMKTEMNDPYILITDKRISNVDEILPILEKIIKSGKKDLVIIAEEIEGEAMATFVINKMRGIFNVLGIKTPGFGDRRKVLLEDIAILTGGRLITEEIGLKLENVELIDLGSARKVISSKEDTIIVGGEGDKIKQRIEQIKKEKELAISDFDKDKFQERIAKLSGGVAVIKVGAATEIEMKEKKDRIEDALNAAKSAVEEGIVPGGGLALLVSCYGKNLKFVKFIKKLLKHTCDNIIDKAILEPIKIIANNSGARGFKILRRIIRKNKNSNVIIGYDAANGKFVDMIKSGIVDATKGVRLSLENASSAAMMALTTEVVIVDKLDKNNKIGG